MAIDREVGNRYGEAMSLVCLADAYRDLGMWHDAYNYGRQAIELADTISNAQAQSDARISLALTHLLAGDTPAAEQTAAAAREHAYRLNKSLSSLLVGLAQFGQD